MGKTFTIEATRTPDYPAMMLAVILALKDIKRAATIHEIVARVIKNEEVTEEDQSHLMKDGKTTKLKYHLHWSCSCLKPSGILEQPRRGLWKLTRTGLEVSTVNQTTDALYTYRESVAQKAKEKRKKQQGYSVSAQPLYKTPRTDDIQESVLPENRNFVISPDAAPSIPGIMLATIIAIKELGGSGHIYQIIACVIKNEGMSEEEQSCPLIANGNRPKLDYYLSWTRTYLKISGDLESVTYGTWALTDAGHQINNLQDAEVAYGKYIARLAQRNSKKEEEEEKANNDAELPVIGEKIAPDDKAWRVTLLGYLRVMEPDAFEYLSKLMLCKAGFKNVKVTGGVADGGVDGVGFLHENLLSRKIYFQCKRWTKNIGSPQIRNFRGALDGRVNQGLFIATSRFTAPAIKEATRDGAILIDLIDEKKLCDLLKEHKLGVETSPDGQTITSDPNYFTNLTPNPQQ